jgi:uncharacterized repeat protein (TIGR03803 family)
MTQRTVYTGIATWLALCAAATAQAPKPKFTVVARIGDSYAGLVQGSNGQLYSTTAGGSRGGGIPGNVFEITTGGQLTKVDALSGLSEAGLLLATDGNFYGTTLKGGEHMGGRIIRVTPSGELTNFYAFCAKADCADGEYPLGALIQGTDGNLYGTTTRGGPGCTEYAYGCGTFFKITLEGEITTLYTFCLQASCLDGEAPQGAIVQASDGNFYGTTDGGGTGRGGTIYRLTPTGTFTVLYSFCSESGCADGTDAVGGLAVGPDGALYGGTESYPVVFKITLDGTFQVLATLCPGPECRPAYAPPVPATDGYLYGTTAGGGKNHLGTIYRITTSGDLTMLHSFCALKDCKDGAQPMGPILQATDGNLYGTTYGEGGGGVVYKLSLGLAPFVTPVPAFGSSGQQVSILGNDLTGATAVSFSGTPAASFTVNSTGSAITATVPGGATSGSIQVTLADGTTTLTSNVQFQVLQ